MNTLSNGIDPAHIHLDHRLVLFEERPSSVVLTFAHGARYEADVLIAADGVHSVVRRALYGDDNPTYTGQMVWRALLNGRRRSVRPAGAFRPYSMGGTGPAFLCLLPSRPLGREHRHAGGHRQMGRGKLVDTPVIPTRCARAFPIPNPGSRGCSVLVTDAPNGACSRDPLSENWGHGRVQLIGDAAHAMPPNAGQGACQAFEDAYTLARWLDAKRSDPLAALRQFPAHPHSARPWRAAPLLRVTPGSSTCATAPRRRPS